MLRLLIRSELFDKLRQAVHKKRTTKLDVVKDDLVGYLKAEIKSLRKLSTLSLYEVIYISE